jgi:hypothetical protein
LFPAVGVEGNVFTSAVTDAIAESGLAHDKLEVSFTLIRSLALGDVIKLSTADGPCTKLPFL